MCPPVCCVSVWYVRTSLQWRRRRRNPTPTTPIQAPGLFGGGLPTSWTAALLWGIQLCEWPLCTPAGDISLLTMGSGFLPQSGRVGKSEALPIVTA
jgi:hypothetical protein